MATITKTTPTNKAPKQLTVADLSPGDVFQPENHYHHDDPYTLRVVEIRTKNAQCLRLEDELVCDVPLTQQVLNGDVYTIDKIQLVHKSA